MSITLSPKLAKALYDCQTEVTAVTKRGKNPAYKSTYAKIEDVIETLKPALEKAGLFVVQTMTPSEKSNHIGLKTIIGHSSGEAAEFFSDMPYEGSGPQKAISACTYARRTQLVSLFFLPTEDDDGHHASTPPPKVEPKHQSAPPEAPKVDASTAIWEEAKKQGWSKPQLIHHIAKVFKKGSVEALNREEQIQLFKTVAHYNPDQV